MGSWSATRAEAPAEAWNSRRLCQNFRGFMAVQMSCVSSYVRESSPAMDLRRMSKAHLQQDSDEARAHSNRIKMAKCRRNASRSDPIGTEIGKST